MSNLQELPCLEIGPGDLLPSRSFDVKPLILHLSSKAASLQCLSSTDIQLFLSEVAEAWQLVTLFVTISIRQHDMIWLSKQANSLL
jgi:hypothetical protein